MSYQLQNINYFYNYSTQNQYADPNSLCPFHSQNTQVVQNQQYYEGFDFGKSFFDDILDIELDFNPDLNSNSSFNSSSNSQSNNEPAKDQKEKISSAINKKERRKEMREWLLLNQNYPYPTAHVKQFFAERYNLTIPQITNFFINERRRFLKRSGLSKRLSINHFFSID